MSKIRYKEPSLNFKENSAIKDFSKLRSSVGKEGYVGEYYNLSVDLLVPYSKQARKLFDESQIIELAATIKEHGIQSPLLVFASQNILEKFEVVSGERRLRAAIMLGLKKVPCIIINEATAEEVALIENIQRTDLHPVEIGDAINSIVSDSKWGEVSKIADKIGKDQSTISNYLSYARLPQEIKKILIDRNIKSRDLLRKIIKAKILEEMLLILDEPSSKSTPKSVIRVVYENNEFKIQDKAIKKFNSAELRELKNKITDLLLKIDNLI
jgi:ParB family chromosome partitioning protein